MKDHRLAIGRVFLLAALLALLPAACSWPKVHGITPISPRVGVNQTVDTLQPTFRWKPVAEPDARYDFVIYDSYAPPLNRAASEGLLPGRAARAGTHAGGFTTAGPEILLVG